jgi:hypothetical protein
MVMRETHPSAAALLKGLLLLSALALSLHPATAMAGEGPSEGVIATPGEPGQGQVQWKSAYMDGRYSSIAAADLDKDGVKELFVVSPRGVTIAKVEGGGLRVLGEIRPDAALDLVSAAAADSDSDGVPEVYISAMRGKRPDGIMVEFKGNGYVTTARGIRWLMRTLEIKGGIVLLGQGFTEEEGFSGGLRILMKEGGRVVDRGPFGLGLPDGVDIYRFTAFDGPSGRTLAALDERGYLRLFNEADRKWRPAFKSDEYYGGTLNNIELTGDYPGAPDKEPVAIEGGVLHRDLDNDGAPEIIVKRNVPGGLGRRAMRPSSFKSGEIYSLSPDGAGGVKENWRSRKTWGYIADFLVEDISGDSSPEVVLLVVEGTGGFWMEEKSYVLSYRPPI